MIEWQEIHANIEQGEKFLCSDKGHTFGLADSGSCSYAMDRVKGRITPKQWAANPLKMWTGTNTVTRRITMLR
jgi:uncharacterized repeat protein (TIGR04076 family)